MEKTIRTKAQRATRWKSQNDDGNLNGGKKDNVFENGSLCCLVRVTESSYNNQLHAPHEEAFLPFIIEFS